MCLGFRVAPIVAGRQGAGVDCGLTPLSHPGWPLPVVSVHSCSHRIRKSVRSLGGLTDQRRPPLQFGSGCAPKRAAGRLRPRNGHPAPGTAPAPVSGSLAEDSLCGHRRSPGHGSSQLLHGLWHPWGPRNLKGSCFQQLCPLKPRWSLNGTCSRKPSSTPCPGPRAYLHECLWVVWKGSCPSLPLGVPLSPRALVSASVKGDNPRLMLPPQGDRCLMGQRRSFRKRKTASLCINGRNFTSALTSRVCPCQDSDFHW